jgi:hypothetical protein
MPSWTENDERDDNGLSIDDVKRICILTKKRSFSRWSRWALSASLGVFVATHTFYSTDDTGVVTAQRQIYSLDAAKDKTTPGPHLATVVSLAAGASTPWVVPNDVGRLSKVQCWGPGGGGGSASGTTVGRLGGGGGGGGYGELNLAASLASYTPGVNVAINVGAGGAAASATNTTTFGNSGTGDTYFGGASFAAAPVGGSKGVGGQAALGNAATANGGAGGTGKGDLSFSGGRGGNATSTGSSAITGCGGGGSAGPDGAGATGVDSSGNAQSTTNGGTGDGGLVAGGTGGAPGTAGTSSSTQGGGGGGGGRGATGAGTGGAPGGGGGGQAQNATTLTVSSAGSDGKILITYTPQAAPTTTSVSPAIGLSTGGTAVTITGTDFLNATGVTFGGVAATSVVVVNQTTITCVTPAHANGLVNVIVTNPVGAGSGTNKFTYYTPFQTYSRTQLLGIT